MMKVKKGEGIDEKESYVWGCVVKKKEGKYEKLL